MQTQPAFAGAMLPRPLRIAARHQDTADVFTIQLVDSTGALAFRPGQFNMLYVFGVGEAPISICSEPDNKNSVLHTTRIVGPVTRALGELRKGDTLGVRGPYGTAWPVSEALGKDVVLVAGGIGLAPLRPVLYHILARREQYGRVSLLYGARAPEDILYGAELDFWRTRLGVDVHMTVDRAPRGWKGNVGVVTTLMDRISFQPEQTLGMLCGPEIMMRYASLELQKRKVATSQIYASMERNMKCAVGFCGHCQFGPAFVCKDGPVFRYDALEGLLSKKEL